MMEVKIVDCGEGLLVCLSINLKITPIFTRGSFWQLCIRLKAGIVAFLFFFFEPSRLFFFPFHHPQYYSVSLSLINTAEANLMGDLV